MKDIAPDSLKNVVVMGHTGSGKTSLVDAVLFKLGLNDRLGSVDKGSSAADYTDEERARKITIFAKPFSGVYTASSGRQTGLVLIDTPGYQDFFGQVIAASRAAETALITVSASAGVQVGTRSAWKCAAARGLARAMVVTGLDKDNTDFSRVVADIQAVFGKACVPVVLPRPGGGVIDVLGASDIPAELADRAAEIRNALTELAAETDDKLMEKFFEEGSLPAEELAAGLVRAVRDGGLVPIFACLPLRDAGITELLDGIARLAPSPLEREVRDAAGKPVATDASGFFVGLVWRTVNDPFVGQIVFVRVLGGTLASDSEIMNASRGEKERIGALLQVNGKKQDPVAAATPGDIVAIPKLKVTKVGDTLCATGHAAVLPPIVFPRPVMLQAVRAKTQADEDKIGTALARVAEEDPTLVVQRNTETREIVLAGLGDVHMDVAANLMKNRSGVDVIMETPKVPYRETVTATGEGHYKHKKQSGGRGQYGEVYLRVEPRRPDEEEWFIDAIVGGVIPGNFLPAIQKGLVDGMKSGAVAGYPVTDVKVTVYDGSYHEVDSSEIAFKIAGARAFKDGMSKARPVLLEPIMSVKVSIPEQYMGDINGDLNQRRGRILGMDNADGMQVITADVPQAELFRYAAELRSMTGGQGTFEMEFSRYEQVPSNVAQKIIAAAVKEKEEE
ncbi:MAG: elongation factor G [Lentisphaerae bacterium]|nr:elongation factor G [Lentisphaerota bacterium]